MLANFHTILTRYPEMRVVIDHCMKPQISNHPNDLQAWANGMARLAADTKVFFRYLGFGLLAVSVAGLARLLLSQA